MIVPYDSGIAQLIESSVFGGNERWWILRLVPSNLSVRPKGDAVKHSGRVLWQGYFFNRFRFSSAWISAVTVSGHSDAEERFG